MTDHAGPYLTEETRLAIAMEEAARRLESGGALPNARRIVRDVVDIPALRARHNLTQQDFSDLFGIAVGTLRNWEQGRRTPDGPARILLRLIERRPELWRDIREDAGVSEVEQTESAATPFPRIKSATNGRFGAFADSASTARRKKI